MRFVFDLDGTIVFKGKPVCKGISDALPGLQKDGHEQEHIAQKINEFSKRYVPADICL
ncbi:hypothetical protein QRX25_03595 [Bacillus sp. L381]|uniref:hypothetical protein n=1 Tax=Bacillus TaxID=1386 RepID=UPI000827365A|nr:MULTISPECIES: hypothetical protein [Bacillus]AOC90202.1 hypothetical protein BARD7_00711 [Bacillus amyloliquefaciens]MCR9040297.1 hypothetical protein [Bacillus velezensis]QUN10262.1 hypothetical protein KEF49_03555 [Bacillus amyloliquefaciens]QYM83362.1 hypothetical protein KTJ85_03550 [Bacillus sp. 7D3]QZY12577.1 hypothetical protein K7B13_03585 [Bacillus amyloliquefaciens]